MNARARARAVFSNDAQRSIFETLKRLRNMLMRWKSKDKSSGKSSSAGTSLGKKKRKFGREGKKQHFFSSSLFYITFLSLSHSLSLWLLVFHVRGTPGFFSILPLFVSVFSNNFPGDYVICPWNAGIGRDKALPREQHRFSITDSEDLMQQGRSILSVYSDEITDAKCLVPWMTILVITRKHASIRTL